MNLENELFDAFDSGCASRLSQSTTHQLSWALHPPETGSRTRGRPFCLTLAHIRQCAPCFDELKELRQKERIQARSGLRWVLRVRCFSIVIDNGGTSGSVDLFSMVYDHQDLW